MNAEKAREFVEFARQVAEEESAWADWHNIVFGTDGKFKEMFPTERERAEFSESGTYSEIEKISDALRIGKSIGEYTQPVTTASGKFVVRLSRSLHEAGAGVMGEWTSDSLADELLGLDIEKDWPRLRELILTAENFDFTLDQSALLAPRLLDLAVQYRDSDDQQDAAGVRSAIRTGASMLRPNEVDRLLALLEPGHSIDTCLVALKMLWRIFEGRPPERPDQHTDLADDIRRIAESLLNSCAIASSKSAAVAQLAVCALAAMASTETLNIVRTVRRMGVPWFSQQTAHELRELRRSWNARAAPEVLELLERAALELQAEEA